MYRSIPLVSIPYTLQQLGSPIEVGGEPNDYDEMQPTVNYSMKVQLKSAIDTLVGKIANSTDDGGYPGQPKIVRHTNGQYYLSYVGLDRLYTSDFVTEPTDWVNSGWSNFEYVEKDKYITLTAESSAWKKYYKNFGTNYFTYDNDVILRFSIKLPDLSSNAYVWPCVGFLPSTATSATNTIGVAFVQVGSPPVWYAGCYRDGSSQAGNLIALEPDKMYTVDVILQRTTNNLIFRIWDSSGLVGTSYSEGVWSSSEVCNSIGVWNIYSAGSTDMEIRLYGFEVWMNTVIVKRSVDNCKSWKKIEVNPSAFGNEVTECSLATGGSRGMVYLVWIDRGTGTPSGYFAILYSYYNPETGTWSSAQQLSELTGNYDRLHPNIGIDPAETNLHVCWRYDTPTGSDLKYQNVLLGP